MSYHISGTCTVELKVKIVYLEYALGWLMGSHMNYRLCECVNLIQYDIVVRCQSQRHEIPANKCGLETAGRAMYCLVYWATYIHTCLDSESSWRVQFCGRDGSCNIGASQQQQQQWCDWAETSHDWKVIWRRRSNTGTQETPSAANWYVCNHNDEMCSPISDVNPIIIISVQKLCLIREFVCWLLSVLLHKSFFLDFSVHCFFVSNMYILHEAFFVVVEKCAGCSVVFTTILKRRV